MLGNDIELYTDNSEYAIRETCRSMNGHHQIFIICARNSGMGIIIDGHHTAYDDVIVRFCPVISNDGDYAWIQQTKGLGYDVIWRGSSILHSNWSRNC